MSDRRFPRGPIDEPGTPYPDLYAFYKDGIREVGVGVSASSDFRFVLAIAAGAAMIFSIVMLFAGYVVGAAIFAGSSVLLTVGAAMALARTNAKTIKDSADEPPDTGIGEIGEGPTGGDEG